MANHFASIIFPLDGNKLHFRICYQVVLKSLLKKIYSLDLDFQYKERAEDPNHEESNKRTGPSVQSLSYELKRLVLDKVLSILGKNVQITGLLMETESSSVYVHMYELVRSTSNTVLTDTSLYFVLQFVKKRSIYHFFM